MDLSEMANLGRRGTGWRALLFGALLAAGCGSSNGDRTTSSSGSGGAGPSTSTSTGGSTAAGAGHHAGGHAQGAGGSGGMDAGPPDICKGVLFCEKFDGYPTVTTIADKQMLGPWHASLETGATMQLDGGHTTSGSDALHIHIDMGKTAGGRLFSDGAQPLFMNMPTHIYGRMMTYIDPNGTSINWAYFGVYGDAQAPTNGRMSHYELSSLPKNGVNTYSSVYGLTAQGSDGTHDCSAQSMTAMPTAAWSCISFEMDSVTRKLRIYKDGAATPVLAIDDHGTGCVPPTPVDDPWYGPAINQLFVGAWSYHPMNAPLDVWIDDFVVDTNPVSCPAP